MHQVFNSFKAHIHTYTCTYAHADYTFTSSRHLFSRRLFSPTESESQLLSLRANANNERKWLELTCTYLNNKQITTHTLLTWLEFWSDLYSHIPACYVLIHLETHYAWLHLLTLFRVMRLSLPTSTNSRSSRPQLLLQTANLETGTGIHSIRWAVISWPALHNECPEAIIRVCVCDMKTKGSKWTRETRTSVRQPGLWKRQDTTTTAAGQWFGRR